MRWEGHSPWTIYLQIVCRETSLPWAIKKTDSSLLVELALHVVRHRSFQHRWARVSLKGPPGEKPMARKGIYLTDAFIGFER
jgi:hypothetical protein